MRVEIDHQLLGLKPGKLVFESDKFFSARKFKGETLEKCLFSNEVQTSIYDCTKGNWWLENRVNRCKAETQLIKLYRNIVCSKCPIASNCTQVQQEYVYGEPSPVASMPSDLDGKGLCG